jgi:hypothetical protein
MTTTYNSVAMCLEQLSIMSGNEITMRDCLTANGWASAIITDRKPSMKGNPESVLVATQDRSGIWRVGTEYSLSAAIGSAITFTAPKAQITSITNGDRNKLAIDEIEWQCNKNGTTANQSLSIVFS